MRIIPKNTKIKIQFYRSISVADIVLAVVGLAFISLAVSSNLPNKYIIAVAIFVALCPLYITFNETRLYTALMYALKFLFAKKTFSSGKHNKSNINAVIPYQKIESNLIKQKDDFFTGVVEICPIEFNFFNEQKQNYFIDGLFSNILKNIGVYQELDIVKLERPIIFDNYIKNELTRMQNIIEANEKCNLSEEEFRARANVLEDRINIIDKINSEEKIYASCYYIVIHDIDKKSLASTLDLIVTSLNNNNLNAKKLNNKELALFIKYSYSSDFDERDFDKVLEKDYISKSVPNILKFKTTKVLQDNKQLTHFIITDYPLKVANAWGQELFDIPNTKVVLKAEPVDRLKEIKRIDGAINELLSQRDIGKASSQIDKETHLSSLQSTLVGLQNENESFFDVSIIITAYDEFKQNTSKKLVRRKLREMGFRFSEMFGRQIDGYMSGLITKGNKSNINRGLNSSCLASCFPFVSNAILDENGILIGENKLPTFVDFFKRDDERVNSNMIIIGKSGSGKSFATKTTYPHFLLLTIIT
ncbi:MAG: hypothetical protein WC942_05950 [Clostridia bacterium]|jgi:hypothetical protein